MNQLIKHNKDIKTSYNRVLDLSNTVSCIDLDEMDSVIRECVSAEDMKTEGCYFTGQTLAALLISKLDAAITDDSIVLDPTCGAGNLLIQCSRQLGVQSTLSKTLLSWGRVLRGFDIHPTFVEATKLRLILEAISRGAKKDCTLKRATSYFSHIKVKNFMQVKSEDLLGTTHALINPPFIPQKSPQEGIWKKGKVNAAAVIFEHCLNLLPNNANISAILPDVLRSGSRYQPWRGMVCKKMIAECNVYGRFNHKTDVDVFILNGVIQNANKEINWGHGETGNADIKISDNFDVRVGPLVAYRDEKKGTNAPYVYPKNTAAWKVLKSPSEYRHYSGKLIKPPFVVIRRTSSPSDKNRATASIVNWKAPTAVENHLIVLKPNDGLLSTCEKLLLSLKRKETNEYLNQRIRCRHLTVGVIKELPYFRD